MKSQHLRTLGFCVVIYIMIPCVRGDPKTTNKNGTEPDDLNGEKLMELGSKLKLPKLRLIGKTIDNLELKIKNDIKDVEKKTARKICDFNSCMSWTEWSECSSNLHLFGIKVRTRQCIVNKDTCKADTSNSRTEKEFGICGGFCPKDYNVTNNRFCLKLYSDKKRTQESAEQQCQKDGGHLINIDSDEKYEDVSSLMKGFGGNDVWIDGRRKDISSPWERQYGSQKGFFKWKSGQPTNGSKELCISSGSKLWYDQACTDNYYAICEVV